MYMITSFDQYAEIAFNLEGTNYENDPNDECTKFGIVVSDLQTFYGHPSTCEDVKALTEDAAKAVLKKLYWDKIQGDNINNVLLAAFICDSCLNMGVITIIKAVQGIIDVVQDGVVGTQTIGAINGYNAVELYHKLYGWRLSRYQSIVTNNPSKQIYYKGWINRLNAITVQ